MTDQVDAVLFDLDDTICAYRRSGSEILDTAFETVGVDPERAVKIGDSLSLDVAGAHNAGVQSVWLEQEGPRIRSRRLTIGSRRWRNSARNPGRNIARSIRNYSGY